LRVAVWVGSGVPRSALRAAVWDVRLCGGGGGEE